MPLLSLATGVSLDLTWSHPQLRSEQGQKLAICLHPWSWLGGNKNDPVLELAADVLIEHNYHVLRFNSRGVGRSQGRATFSGFSEVEDLQALVQSVVADVGNVDELLLVGYSHGSLITSLYPVSPDLKTSHLLISYPLGPRAFLTLFNSSIYQNKLQQLVAHPLSRVLVVYGDQDEFTSAKSYHTWTTELSKYSHSPTSLRLQNVPGATHFWRGASALELQRIINEWISPVLSPSIGLSVNPL